MIGPRFKSALRTMLYCLGEGLMWMGVPFGMDAGVAAEVTRTRSAGRHCNSCEHSDQLSMKPLSRAERAEWAALVERLR